MRATFTFILILSVVASSAQDALTLQEALDMAFRDNFGVRIERNNSEIAVNNNTPGNAGMLPQVLLDGQKQWSTSNTEQQFITGDDQQVDNASSESLDASLELNWTIFDGMRMFAAKDRLELEARAGRVQLRAEMEQMAAQLIAQYYRLVQEKALLKVYENTLELSKERLSLMQRRKEVGSGSELDLAQARNDRNEDSTLVIDQQNLISNLKADINLLLGREPDEEFSATSELNVERNLRLEPLRQSLDSMNSSLALARIETRVAKQRVQEEKGGHYPELDVFGRYTYGESQSDAGFLVSSQSYGPVAGLRLSWNLFDGNNTRRRIANRIIEEDNAEIRLERASASATRDLITSFNDYQSALKTLSLEEENLQQQQRILDVAMKRLDLGTLSNIEFREFQLSFARAENRLLTAEYNAKLAETQLLLNAGRLEVRE